LDGSRGATRPAWLACVLVFLRRMPTVASETAPIETIQTAGLSSPAEIVVDRWGIPHIRAGNLDDLFFAQGFNAARDRLWQIDLWRKRGLGLLAAELGPGFLAQDRAARLFLYRGDMDAEWASYAPDAKAICEAFAAGVNAYVDLTEREPERLPPEFGLVGTRPARWVAEDVVRIRSHGLTRNALSEVLRANVLAKADPATDLLRKNLEPPVTPRIAEGVDLAAIPLEVLDVFKLATAPVTITPERLRATLKEAEAWTKVTDLGDVVRDSAWQGSNNWVVHGSLTDTGRPILANDPHRAHAVPSLRYLVHLTAPGFDAIGAGEPAVPGLSLGHNGEIAFGLTIFGADQEDVYVYETKESDPNAYRYGGGWESMRLVEERLSVKGEADQVITLKFTRHGPVVYEDPARRLAFAIRSVWFEPGAAAYLASLGSMRARTFEEFRTAMRRWGAPSVNQVYADTQGTIAWLPVGFMPVRPNWDGLLPMPGDGRFEWAGVLDPDLLPRIVNPPKGFFATANEMNLPPDWDHAKHPVAYEWTDRARATRIHESLEARRPQSVASSCALQTDPVSVPGRRVARVLEAIAADHAEAAAALDLLRGWDGDLRADSAPAALFEVWWTKHLKPALFARVAADPTVRALLPPGDVDTIVSILENPDARFGDDPVASRNALMIEALCAAYRDCAKRMGPDRTTWAWGRLHHGYFEHALSGIAPPEGPADFNVGPLPKGGSAASPMHAGYRPGDFRVIAGASVRIVVDVGDWDRSVCINAPGQSGDPRSPHYCDLAPFWAKGEYVPMLYTWEAIEREAETRIALLPA
jgi:penicillin G amidase